MHILVAALLALSCFIPVFGSLSSGGGGPVSNDVQSERVLPESDERGGDSFFDGNRGLLDRPDVNQGDQGTQNGGTDQNGSDADGPNDDQTTPDGTTQNGDRSSGKRLNRTPDDQSGTTTPNEGAVPDGSATPGNGAATPNNGAPITQGTV